MLEFRLGFPLTDGEGEWPTATDRAMLHRKREEGKIRVQGEYANDNALSSQKEPFAHSSPQRDRKCGPRAVHISSFLQYDQYDLWLGLSGIENR